MNSEQSHPLIETYKSRRAPYYNFPGYSQKMADEPQSPPPQDVQGSPPNIKKQHAQSKSAHERTMFVPDKTREKSVCKTLFDPTHQPKKRKQHDETHTKKKTERLATKHKKRVRRHEESEESDSSTASDTDTCSSSTSMNEDDTDDEFDDDTGGESDEYDDEEHTGKGTIEINGTTLKSKLVLIPATSDDDNGTVVELNGQYLMFNGAPYTMDVQLTKLSTKRKKETSGSKKKQPKSKKPRRK